MAFTPLMPLQVEAQSISLFQDLLASLNALEDVEDIFHTAQVDESTDLRTE
jgi:hypothetical protein